MVLVSVLFIVCGVAGFFISYRIGSNSFDLTIIGARGEGWVQVYSLALIMLATNGMLWHVYETHMFELPGGISPVGMMTLGLICWLSGYTLPILKKLSSF